MAWRTAVRSVRMSNERERWLRQRMCASFRAQVRGSWLRRSFQRWSTRLVFIALALLAFAAARYLDFEPAHSSSIKHIAPVPQEASQTQVTSPMSRDVSGTDDAPYYRNCAAARAAGVAPIYRGEPGYAPWLDRDNDGIACEPWHGHR